MTFLRILRRTPAPPVRSPQILVDLEQGLPVDLLPNRQAITFASWLQDHLGILVISRDCAGEFATVARVSHSSAE
jgi:transposase